MKVEQADTLWKRSAADVVDLLKTEQISPHDALDSIEIRLEAVEPAIGALPIDCFDRARENIDRLLDLPVDKRGLLAGLPVTIKDLTQVAGVRTTFGSALYVDHIATESDRIVRRLEQRGAIVYAKSNTPEFGTGGITFNDLFPPTRSPRNLRFASGGSSGGAAASLAAGSAWLSLGSDMAGSLRTPAAFCGVTSLRPSPGRIATDSEYLPFDVLAATGPMARSIADLGLFADAMMHEPPGSMQTAARSPAAPGRVAISADLGVTEVECAIAAMTEQVATALARENVSIEHIHPDLSGAHTAFDVLRAHDYAIGLEQTLAEHPGVMKPEVEWNIRQGLALDTAQLRVATRLQGQVINRAARFMEDYDLLICPATSVVSVDAELRYPGFGDGIGYHDYYRWLAIAYAITVTTLPVVTLPWTTLTDGMPGALQLIGKPGGENRLLQHAAWLEQLSGWDCAPVNPQ